MGKDNTKDRILDAAEILFSKQEYSGTSLRSITTEAGVNLAAVNYYFGSKKELYQAVIARRVGPLNEHRLKLLDAVEAEAGSEPMELASVLRAFLEPVFSLQDRERTETGRFFMIATRAHIEPDPEIQAVFIGMFAEIFQRFMKALKQALPQFDEGFLVMKFHFLIGSMIHTLHWDRFAQNPVVKKFPSMKNDVLLEHLIRFAAEGMRADAVENPGENNEE